VRTDDESVIRGVDFISHDAEQNFPTQTETVFDVALEDGRYLIREDGEFRHSPPDYDNLIYNLLGFVNRTALEGFADTIRMHAGCGDYNGYRFLVVGDKGAGKSTLMMHLLSEGFHVSGDELALIDGEQTMPFPRRFHLKDGSVPLLPELESMIERVPFINLYGKGKIYSFSPLDAGYEWKVESRKADAIFFLEPNHGGKTLVEECPKFEMARRIMPMTLLSESRDHLKISSLCKIIDDAGCYILRVGDLAGTADSMREKMSPSRSG
jgi:hypothetical protein